MGVNDVIKAFERLSAADRMELMCRLFDRSLPCEIRFMCSVLHDMASRDHESLQKLESHVNKLDAYKHQKDLSDIRGQICHTLALINPDNRAVANAIYSLLNSSNVLFKLNNTPTDSIELDEYRLLYTMAVNHPVFTYEQRCELRKNFLSELDAMAKELWKKEKNRSRTSLADSDSGKDEKTSSGRRFKPSPIAEIEKDSSICLAQCEVKGVHRRAADGRFVYIVEVKWSNNMMYLVRRTYGEFFTFQTELLNLFPEEAGEKKNRKGRKVRVIPYLPGKKLFSKASGQEIAEKRLPEMAKYTKELMKLPSHVTQSDHVINFFMHHAQDLKENGFPLHKMTTPDKVISDTGSTECIDYGQRSSSFHHSRNQAINIASSNLPKHHSLPARGKDSGGGQTETLKSSQQSMFTSSPLYVNFEDMSNANSNSSLATSESQENHPDEDDEDGIQPLKEFEGQEWKAFTSVRSDSIIAIEAPSRFVKQQEQPTAGEDKETSESGEPDTQHDDILNFCADEIAAGAAGSNFSTPQGTPSISPSHTPTLTRTPTPQGTTSHVGPIHPVLVPKTSGNSNQFTYQNPPSGGHPFVNASPLPSPHIKKYGSSTLVPRDPYEFETLFLWLKDLRLHKYLHVFSNLSFDEMCKMKGEDMVSKGMTKGATKKLLLKLAQLKVLQFTGFPDMPGSGQIRRRSSTCSLPAALRLAEHPSPSPTLIDHHGSGVKRSISGYNLTGCGSRPNSDIIDDPSFLDHAILQAGPFIPTNAPPYSTPCETPPPDTMSIHSDTENPGIQEIIHQPSLQRKNAMRIRHNLSNPGELVMDFVVEDHMQQQHKMMGQPITTAAILPQMPAAPPMHFTNHPHPQNPNWPGHMMSGPRPAMLPPNIQYHPIRQPGAQPIPQFPAGVNVNGLPGGMIRPFPPQISFVPNHIQPTAGFPPQFPPRGNNAGLVMCCNCGQHGHIGSQCGHATPDNQNKSFHRSLRQSFSNPPNLNANNSKLL